MQALMQLIAGFIAMLAAAALSQFGVDLHTPRQADREIHRITDCDHSPASLIATAPAPRQDC
ncbi:MAG: hypothetical protein ACOH1H_01195 [Brevundimonas sp.]|jgi:hypothetical protein